MSLLNVNFSSVLVLSFLGGLMIMWLCSSKNSSETSKQGEASDEYTENVPKSVVQVTSAEK